MIAGVLIKVLWSSGVPPPEVVWLHEGLEVTESEDFHLLREGNRFMLLIQEVFPEDNGTYCCRAWNQNGEAQTQAQLTVEEPQEGVQPWFITRPQAVSAVVGQQVLLSCAVAGDPFPEHAWTLGAPGRPLTSGGDYELLQKDDVVSLLIRSDIRVAVVTVRHLDTDIKGLHELTAGLCD
ncbi:hypothetical protein EPR50_G00113750 [Perca flavescens]|uniref:Ig-like domain-containing protein n=1 Tax=Perca flavescens TaxID=8167 RepID=A0A484CS96_PERFV|nr:hypothetical protein EPR50_G00113750 [Perca flavescens]